MRMANGTRDGEILIIKLQDLHAPGGQKVRSGFSILSDRKFEWSFWPTQYVNTEPGWEKEVILRAFHSVQAFLYLTSAGPGFLCRAPMLISISIPIYPQLASLSLMISIRACSFSFTFTTSPEKCCLCASVLLGWLLWDACPPPDSTSEHLTQHSLLSPSYGISMESRLLPTFLASFPTIPHMLPVLSSAPNLLIASSHRILSFSWLCPFSIGYLSPIFPSE